MSMYRIETRRAGNVIPYTRYWYYHGGYESQKNAPYGTSQTFDGGVQWQPLKELQLTCEYSLVDRINTTNISKDSVQSYNNFQGSVIRLQLQWNY